MMESLEERIERLEFYQRIFLAMSAEEYPFYKLVIERGLNEKEMKEIYTLCEELDKTLEVQMEDGFIHYTPLLIHFVGMLNSKLDPLETIKALHKQNLYRTLMSKLEEIINEENK